MTTAQSTIEAKLDIATLSSRLRATVLIYSPSDQASRRPFFPHLPEKCQLARFLPVRCRLVPGARSHWGHQTHRLWLPRALLRDRLSRPRMGPDLGIERLPCRFWHQCSNDPYLLSHFSLHYLGALIRQ